MKVLCVRLGLCLLPHYAVKRYIAAVKEFLPFQPASRNHKTFSVDSIKYPHAAEGVMTG